MVQFEMYFHEDLNVGIIRVIFGSVKFPNFVMFRNFSYGEIGKKARV